MTSLVKVMIFFHGKYRSLPVTLEEALSKEIAQWIETQTSEGNN